MKRITILGSTGSIGVSSLKIMADFPDRFKIIALSAGDNIELLAKQIRQFKPEIVSVRRKESADILSAEFKDVRVECGIEGLIQVAAYHKSDLVISAIVGAAGLIPTCAAIASGKDVALANKETLVMAGPLIKRMIAEKGVKLIPIDSEHSAIMQCLEGQDREQVERIILTASGGPFAKYSASQLAQVSPAQALAHPTWSMGAKISLDSATMMNKGLEVIEAHWLFDMPVNKIAVVIHPQSIVHSMIEMLDGSVLAQLGITDMRLPILYALTYPQRLSNKLPRLDLAKVGTLTFSAPDIERFPCLGLAYEALSRGESMPVVLNAANEAAGAAFLKNKITFNDIPALIRECMERHQPEKLTNIERILEIDGWARRQVNELTEKG